MESQRSSGEEEGSTERGVLHKWQGYSCAVTPERVLLSRPVLQAALGTCHGLLLTDGGLVYSFGELPWKRGLSADPVLESSLSGQSVVAVAAGSFHSGAVTEDGRVHMWGENCHGQCGLSGTGVVPDPTPVNVVDAEDAPPQLVRVLSLACGTQHTLALSAKREVWAWGSGCQLGLVTSAFPVWRPQKVEHLAGRYVVQVACGGFHSVALVRCLPPQESRDLPLDQCGQCKQLLYTMVDKDDHVIISDSHYCPLGVELADAIQGQRSTQGSPAQRSKPALSERDLLVSSLTSEDFCPGQSSSGEACRDDSEVEVKPASDRPTPVTLTDGNKVPLRLLKRTNSSPYPDKQALKDYLKRMSHLSWSEQADDVSSETPRPQIPGSSVDLRTSGPAPVTLQASTATGSLANSQEGRSVSASGGHARTFDASFEDPGAKSGITRDDPLGYNGFAPGQCEGSKGTAGDRLRVEESLQAQKSSSLTDVRWEGAEEHGRRRSLPGLLSEVSPSVQRRAIRTGVGAVAMAASCILETENLLPSLSAEVWSWGRGQEGQLGHGDHLPRLQPLCIKSLSKKEVVKVAAGANHSLALTAQCQVFSWGSNKYGQLGHMNTPSTVPQQTKMSEGIRVWDVAAGQTHTLLLADGDCIQPILYYSGEQVVEETPGRAPPQTYTQPPTLLPFCMNMGYVSSVFAGGQTCLALADQHTMGFIATLHDLAAAERKFYCRLSSVKSQILRPLLARESVSVCLGRSSTSLLQTLAGSFSRLCHLVGQHASSLAPFLQRGRDSRGLVMLKEAAVFLDTYKEYCSSAGNFLVMGGFQALVKPSQECFGNKLELLQELSKSKEKTVPPSDLLMSIFYMPIQHLHEYGRLLLKLATCFDVHTTEYQKLQEGCSKYETMAFLMWKKRKEAESTYHFWKKFPGKSSDALRQPCRRLVCESSNKALTLQNAGRFSVNWFILFNDALIHAQGTIPSKKCYSSHHVYPLATLWVEPVTEENVGLFGLRLTTPEDSFTVLAASAIEKVKWLRAVNQAVDGALGAGLDARVPGSSGGQRAEPPASRTARHTFSKDGRLKEATYEGRWRSGKPHGKGTLKWPDGRIYTGTFKNGLEDGFGDHVIPNKSNKCDRYLGHWKEGRMHGFGTHWYATGEVYEGSFQDNLRHGHGMLSSGKLLSSSSSVFVGHWVHDKKTGYGVFDDITRGEKYMGMWLDDQRQGNGVVVTQFGLYHEGAFAGNKMMGIGLLLCEDDTAFQGEFSEDWTLNGKGTLFMPNGDYLEGTFTGEWGTGLKTAGTYVQSNFYEPEKEKSWTVEVGSLAVAPEEKWRAVFEECWSRLGCEAPGHGDSKTAWENIAVTLTTSRRQHRDSPDSVLTRSQNKMLESLEFIPQHTGPITAEAYNNIRRYLIKACDTPLHPLGWLLETLVTAYRMTYVGVGANRRLLRQAVGEITSYLSRIFQLVRFLFPCLPEEGGFIPEQSTDKELNGSLDTSTQPEASQHGWLVSSSSLLLPVLLPRLYPPLFTLYSLEKEREEEVYRDCMLRLNKQPDFALLSFLGVQQKFWPISISVLGEEKQVLPSTKDACFATAVETLQQISTTFTPSDKLLVIQSTFEEVTQEVQALLEQDFLWSMDDLFPLFLYVVLRARIRNLSSEVNLIEDLMDPGLQHGEVGLMFTTLKACCFQIQHEKTT